ncbi:uncharacterized protein LOC135213559 isoform X2 [Macrobrachium nipponense]|uniref:uncharacterized protein LOC135213559 isoform X2 n=1 Tax=Macrobrachium nipponense TaxID=159736 RepID=UPI0030C7C92B
MCRVWGVWAAALAWASAMVAWAGPVDVQNLPVEHRGAAFYDALPDIISSLPSASDDMFIWNGPDGSYRFGMQGADQWRVESRDANGHVEGRYVYKTPDGQTVDVSYGAGPQGYRAKGDAIPGGEAPLYETRDTQTQGETQTQGGILAEGDPQAQEAPYGALVRAGEEAKFPNGNGVTTYADDESQAIVTDIEPQYAQASAVFPVLTIRGTDTFLVGPPTVNDEPLLPAAIAV